MLIGLNRTVAATALVTSLGIHLGVLPYQYFIYHPFFIFKFPPELWRFVTSFFITGGGLSLLFDTYFLYQYMSQLEVGNPRFSRKEDLIWYLTFVSGTILVGLLLPSHAQSHLAALILLAVSCLSKENAVVAKKTSLIYLPG